jgi:predicted Fe-Mo cluster-binding NifX family protein
MKIAFPSHDQKNIFPHFGRTPGFQIITVENGEITNQEFLPNSVTGHAKGQHQEHNHSHNEGHKPSHNHSHSGIMSVLNDCEVVIANGMGRRLYDDFATTDKKVFVTQETNIIKATEMFLNNTLDHNSSTCCSH